MARVSVVIPAYNPGPYLQAAIQSVCDQSFTDWQMCVVDDGSRQDLTSTQAQFRQIKFLRVPNGGVSRARNLGILETVGEYVAFLDSDDLWHTTKLAEQVDFMDRNPDVALCHTDVDYIDETGAKVGAQRGLQLIDSYHRLLAGPNIVTSSVLMRRSTLLAVGLFDPLLSGTEDYELFLRVARGHKIAPIPLTLTSYRKLPQSLSSNYKRMSQELLSIYKQQLLDCRSCDKQQETEKAVHAGSQEFQRDIGRAAYDQCRKAVREGNTAAFVGHFLESLRRNPRFVLQSLLLWLRLVPTRH